MERWGETRLRPDAVAAFVAGVVAAYLIQRVLKGGGFILQMLVVIGVGGLWYHWRRIL